MANTNVVARPTCFAGPTATRSSPEFSDYLLEVAVRYSLADMIHLVMDNLSSHTRNVLVERFARERGASAWADAVSRIELLCGRKLRLGAVA